MHLGSRAFLTAAIVLALTAPLAHGQVEDVITVDPKSPSGKEYALPIDQARRDAANGGKGGRASEAGRPTQAFGEGVNPDRKANSGGGSEPSTGITGSSLSKFVPRAAGSAAPDDPAERARERGDIDRALLKADVDDGGASAGSLALLGGGVVVMVLGVAAGLALRRRMT